jgi:hypothetical protein
MFTFFEIPSLVVTLETGLNILGCGFGKTELE